MTVGNVHLRVILPNSVNSTIGPPSTTVSPHVFRSYFELKSLSAGRNHAGLLEATDPVPVQVFNNTSTRRPNWASRSMPRVAF